MQLDPIKAADTRAWLAKMRNDLRATHVDLQADPPLLEDALFHCQQAVEKSLKAFLTWHDQPFRKTHDLGEVGRQCVAIDPTLADLIGNVTFLTRYAWESRYPGEWIEPTRGKAEMALQAAELVSNAILARLPAGTW